MLARSLPFIKLAVLMSLPIPLIILVSAWLGVEALFFGCLLWVIFVVSVYYLSDKVALKVCNAELLTVHQYPALHRTIEEVSFRAGLSKPRVFIMPGDAPNISIVGRSRNDASIIVTEGLVNQLTHEELRCAVAHELVHLYFRDTLVRSAVAVIATMLGLSSRTACAMVNGSGQAARKRNYLAAAFLALTTPLAAMIVRLSISPREELRADNLAARLLGSPLAMANAIRTMEKKKNILELKADASVAHLFLVSPLRHSRIAQMFTIHPTLEERVRCMHQLAEVLSRSRLALPQA